MANSLLPLTYLANLACAVGVDFGFNAAEVVHYLDANTFEDRLAITWGDREQMCRPRLRTPCEYALAYTEETGCYRAPKQVIFEESIRAERCDTIRNRFVESLLELKMEIDVPGLRLEEDHGPPA